MYESALLKNRQPNIKYMYMYMYMLGSAQSDTQDQNRSNIGQNFRIKYWKNSYSSSDNSAQMFNLTLL